MSTQFRLSPSVLVPDLEAPPCLTMRYRRRLFDRVNSWVRSLEGYSKAVGFARQLIKSNRHLQTAPAAEELAAVQALTPMTVCGGAQSPMPPADAHLVWPAVAPAGRGGGSRAQRMSGRGLVAGLPLLFETCCQRRDHGAFCLTRAAWSSAGRNVGANVTSEDSMTRCYLQYLLCALGR